VGIGGRKSSAVIRKRRIALAKRRSRIHGRKQKRKKKVREKVSKGFAGTEKLKGEGREEIAGHPPISQGRVRADIRGMKGNKIHYLGGRGGIWFKTVQF